MVLIGKFMLAAVITATTPDCGAVINHDLISKTQALVVKAVKPEFVSESLRDSNNACVRFEFAISKSGVPLHIKIVETSGERALDRAATEALKLYRFKPSSCDSRQRFTLIFKPHDN